MKKYDDTRSYTFELTYMEACYLNASVVEFFHNMRRVLESENSNFTSDEKYIISKNLWKKVEELIPVMDWE